MAIHDVDKSQDNRSLPAPNISDTHATRASDGTTAITNKKDGSDGAYVSTKDATVRVNNGIIDVIKLGLQSDGIYAFQFGDSSVPRLLMSADNMKISKPGIDVTTASTSQLIFNSDQNMFKITATASQSVTLTNVANTVAAGTQTTTIAHNLGFKPSFLVYVTTPSSYIDGAVLVLLPEEFVLPAGHVLGGGTVYSRFKARVDDTNLYIDFYHRVGTDYSPSLPTFTIRYYLLQETAN